MVEMLMGWVLRCPRCTASAGGAILSLGGLMGSLGLRLDHRIARVFDRAGTAPLENLREGWPFWISLLLPEGAAGFALAIALMVAGGALLAASRWARRYE